MLLFLIFRYLNSLSCATCFAGACIPVPAAYLKSDEQCLDDTNVELKTSASTLNKKTSAFSRSGREGDKLDERTRDTKLTQYKNKKKIILKLSKKPC